MRQLKEKIEDILENRGSDFEISKAFKTYLNQYEDSLQTIFEQSQGKDFLVKHTKSLDSIISLMYKTVIRRLFHNYLPMQNSIPISIVALGSYGREQLSLHSDIDLMISYVNVEGYNCALIIEKFLYMVWDSGLKLGHRVHETKDILKASREDITIKTALLESRFIVGSTFAWNAVQNELTKVRKENQKEFIFAKIEESKERRKKYPYSMQPNLKEGIGALRDSHLMFWIAHVIYGVTSTKDLSDILFTSEEYKEYRSSIELLFRVRNALHFSAKKQQDVLRLDEMPQIAKMIGMQEPKKLATKVLEAQYKINRFSQIFIKKMIRPFFQKECSFSTLRESRVTNNIYAIEGKLYASFNTPAMNIEALLAMLNSLEDRVWEYDPSIIKLFKNAKIKHPLTQTSYKQMRTLFLRDNIYHFLRLFYDAGVLAEIIPAFRKVMYLPQFDGYHQLPVDLHSIECIKALENIKDSYVKEQFDSLHEDEKLLLKVATLLHDTGKGRNLDHSEVGAKLINAYVKDLGFSETNQKRAALLVKHHVLMSNVAYRSNIYSEKVLYKFMSQVENKYNLKLLYILTYADINGVGKDVYSSFIKNLLHELYDLAFEISSQNSRINDASRRLKIEKRITNLDEFKSLNRTMQKKILTIESNLFFFKYSAPEILHISEVAKNIKEFDFIISNDERLSVQIFRKVDFNLSFFLSSLSYLDVSSMEVFTLFDSTKYFKIEFLEKVYEENIEQIKHIIELSFDMSQKIEGDTPVIKRDEVVIDCEHSKGLAELNITTKNQKGLLAYIAHSLDELEINIATAKISSTKNKARDHFLLEKNENVCSNEEKLISILTKE